MKNKFSLAIKLLLVVAMLFLFTNNYLSSQNLGDCGYVDPQSTNDFNGPGCENVSDAWINKYRTPGYWIPDENTPIKTILVNWIICRDDNGENGWQDIPEFHEQVELMFDSLNYRYSNSKPKGYTLTCEPSYTHVYDTRIRFELNEIIFIDNTTFNLSCYPTDNMFEYLETHYPDYKIAMNHFFTQQENCPWWGRYDNNNSYNQSCILTTGSMYDPNGYWVVWEDHINHIAHEYGHAVGQHHTYNGEQRCISNYDFLDDVFGLCAEPTCSCNSPFGCDDDYVCYFSDECFWQYQDPPYPLMSGKVNIRYISPKSSGRMHRALSCYENTFEINNKFMHKYVKEKHPSEVPLTITEDETWDFAVKMYQDIIVPDGITLTITCEVKMPLSGKIIVEPGGKLIVNGGTITSAHNGFWHGIEVHGNPDASQIPANQGWLSITNGGTIQNAEVAVRVGSEGYPNTGGGIVHTDDAIFRNNRTGVNYHYYVGYNTGDFTLTTFETTAELLDGSLPNAHIRLVGVEGIKINGCTFKNTRDGSTPYSQRGTGIISFDASYYVDHTCTSQTVPCTQYQETVFDSLYYGIKAYAIYTLLAPSVEYTEFTRNYRGAYLSGITNARITSNEFILNGKAAAEGYGLYLDACNQYWVENNYFEKSNTTSTQTGIGIYVSESGNEPNEIYRNVFDSVEYAVIALGNNRYDRRPEIGLQILCNDYNNTLFDEVIVYDGHTDPPPGDDGIASLQGANTQIAEDMAGNLFYYNTDVAGDFDDINNQSNHFYYYYSLYSGNWPVEPLDYTTNTVTKVAKNIIDWDYDEACPSGLISGGGGIIAEARSTMAVAQGNIESTKAVLLALVDGGDTETLNTEIQNSTPPETESVYSELMAESPNLSETVVESSIEKETVLPNAMIRDVMVANPHTSTSLQLLDKLDQRNNPMPAFMKAQILSGRSIQSLKSELEGQLAAYTLRKVRARNRIARYFNATPGFPAKTDSLLALYQADNSLNSRYMQAWLYLQSGQYLNGQNVMTTITSDFTLSEEELSEYQNMQSLYTMLTDLYDAGLHVNELSAAQQAQLELIVLSETGLASVYARNILLAIDALQYNEPVILPNQLKSSNAEETFNAVLNAPMPKMLEVYPNPSKDFVVLGYRFDADTRGLIEIRDVSGSLIQSIPFTGMQDQLTVITRSWASGIYVVSLMVNEKVIETTKFSLID